MDRSKVVVLLDNGHAKSTAGKRSPKFDSQMKSTYGFEQFREYRFNRNVVTALMYLLPNKYGI